MNKVAFITDIHFSVRNGSTYYIERYKLFFKNIFFPYLDKHNIKTVYCLGDTWEDRKSINVNALKETREMFFDELLKRNIEFVAILGNHDIFYKNTNEINSMDIIESAYSNVRIIQEYEEIQIGKKLFGFMSWVNNENIARNLERINSTSKADILCLHPEITGFEMTKGNIADKGFSPTIFKRFERVLAGHFHIKSSAHNIDYIGNPFQTNWDDYNAERGFHAYDLDDNTFTFIENTYRNFEAVIYHDGIDIDTFDYAKYKDLKVKVLITSVADLKQSSYMAFLDRLSESVFEFFIVETEDKTIDMDATSSLIMKTNNEIIVDYINESTLDDTKKQDVINILLDLHTTALNTRETN